MYLLDTDVLSNLLKRAPSITLIAKLAAVPAEWQFTSSITLGELLYGARRRGPQADDLLDRIETRLLPELPVLPFDASAARRYGKCEPSWSGAGHRWETPICASPPSRWRGG